MLFRAVRRAKFGMRLALVAGFGGVLGLMTLAGLGSIRVLHRVEEDHARITQTYLDHHHAFERIRTTLYISAPLVREYLLASDAAAADAPLAELRRLRQGLDTALTSYAHSLDTDEHLLFAQLRESLDAYWKTLAPSLRWNASERRLRGEQFLRTEVVPRQAALARLAEQIDAINEQALRADDRRTAEIFASFRQRMIATLVLTVGLGLTLAALTIARILRLERDARARYEEIVRGREELQRLSARLVEAQEQERRAIARELHDEIGQSFSALLVDIGNLAAILPCADNPEAGRLLEVIRKLAESSVNSVRNLSLLLRPSMLDDLGLVPALHWQAREVGRRTGMRVKVVAEETADELPEEHRTCVYRVVQEALHNCARHAQAKKAQVTVAREDGGLRLTIQDDGQGFDARRTRGLGLIGMEERVRHLGGVFVVESQPGRGTRLAIQLPLPGRNGGSNESHPHSAG